MVHEGINISLKLLDNILFYKKKLSIEYFLIFYIKVKDFQKLWIIYLHRLERAE